MKKSTLSMVSIITGITATTLSALMFPFALTIKSPAAITLFGFIGILTFCSAIVGLITSSVKLLTTSKHNMEELHDRSIAFKGFWFSISPLIFWLFISIVGSIK